MSIPNSLFHRLQVLHQLYFSGFPVLPTQHCSLICATLYQVPSSHNSAHNFLYQKCWALIFSISNRNSIKISYF